ncbi:MAG: hypothetical protein PHH00_01950 [Candidatus Nanoarchaeia archaeon]|nr:hypothetical protein [Candidatus Nanoarchaeia archaeon]
MTAESDETSSEDDDLRMYREFVTYDSRNIPSKEERGKILELLESVED